MPFDAFSVDNLMVDLNAHETTDRNAILNESLMAFEFFPRNIQKLGELSDG